MTSKLKKTMLVLGTTLLATQVFLVHASTIYAESTDDHRYEKNNLVDNSLKNNLSFYEEYVASTEGMIDAESDATESSEIFQQEEAIADSEISKVEDEAYEKQIISEAIEGIRFSMDIGEYIEIEDSECFTINIEVNQPVNSFRLIVPQGAEFSFENTMESSLKETFEDGSRIFLLTSIEKETTFSVNFSFSESGQLTVEDAEGQFHAAFLYVSHRLGRNNLSESSARTSVTVNTWAAFRTAWNNNSRTEILINGTIPFGTTQLNQRTSDVRIGHGASSVTTGCIVQSQTNQILSWADDVTVTVGSIFAGAISIRGFQLSGGNLNVHGSGGVQVVGESNLGNLFVESSEALSVTQGFHSVGTTTTIDRLSLNNGSITTTTPLKVNTLNLDSKIYSIRSVNYSSPVLESVGTINVNTGLSIYNLNNNQPSPDMRWRDLEATVSNGQVINSSTPAFNDQTFQLDNIYWLGWLLSDEIAPPSHNLNFRASPLNGGDIQASETYLEEGRSTTINANPSEGYRFVRWEVISGIGSQIADETAATTSFTMGSEDTLVQAVFEEITYTLSLTASPSSGGTPKANENILKPGETTEIVANPVSGYRFIRWEITSGTEGAITDVSLENTTFTMGTSDAFVQAVFERENVDPLPPVDPLDPETEVDPENPPVLPEDQGLLSIDFVSQFDFGTQGISVHDETYFARSQRLLNGDGTVNEQEARPNYIQISDRRSENDRNGWKLAIDQPEPLRDETGQELRGASITLANQQLATAQGGEEPSLQMRNPLELIPNNKRTLLQAEGNEGTGTWIYRFGDMRTADESVSLFVPQGANPDATGYSTTLVWELSVVPGN